MLKMMKYELMGSYRQYLFGFAIYLIACITVPWIPIEQIKEIGVVGIGMLMMGLNIILIYNVVAYFQRTMFKRQGYLTLTLPVSEEVLILSKLISTMIWYFIGGLILLIGFVIFTFGIGELTISDFLSLLETIGFYFAPYFGKICLALLELLCAAAATVMFVFLVITFVHTHWIKKHRALIGIVIYFLSMIILSSISENFLPLLKMDWTMIFASLLATLASYGATVYLVKKHIELE